MRDELGDYKFDAGKLSYVHEKCQEFVKFYMEEGNDIIVSNTFTTEKELQPYLDMAEEYGYTVVSLIVENRHGGKSIHNVPETTMEKMRQRFSIKL